MDRPAGWKGCARGDKGEMETGSKEETGATAAAWLAVAAGSAVDGGVERGGMGDGEAPRGGETKGAWGAAPRQVDPTPCTKKWTPRMDA